MITKVMFPKVTPESVGVSSEKVHDFVRMMDDYRMNNHSFVMMRGDKIIAETYYKPFHEDFLHRMYSVSKTFVAMAVGMAVTEGLIGMDDVIVDYFPEFRSQNVDEFYEECTVRNMLSMQSNIGKCHQWWGLFNSRVESYYVQKTNKIPGTLYYYDSIGSFLLGCIIEKLTGKTFLEYLKEKVLLEIGFSKESYVLREPGGYAVGDSGVMCTTRDLMLFARFIMKKGEWNGKQYIDREFMENAIVKQVNNDLDGGFKCHSNSGYGYLIWKTHEEGFTLTGLGDQLAICDMERDFLFVITSDNQADKATRYVIFHELLRHFLPALSEKPLPENEEAYISLQSYLENRELLSQYGERDSLWAEQVNGVRYRMLDNPLQISWFMLHLPQKGDEGYLEFERKGEVHKLFFALCRNKLTKFSFGERAVADRMGVMEAGEYQCAGSAAWTEENRFSIRTQVIDTYFGGLYVHLSFVDDRVSMYMKSSGQYIFTDVSGYAIGKKNRIPEEIDNNA